MRRVGEGNNGAYRGRGGGGYWVSTTTPNVIFVMWCGWHGVTHAPGAGARQQWYGRNGIAHAAPGDVWCVGGWKWGGGGAGPAWTPQGGARDDS